MNILMVEDDQYLAMKIMQEFKKTAPVNLMRHISSYEEFLQNTEYKIYDIILLDICLSAKANDDNGFSILEYVRKKDKKIPIIIISNMVQYDYLEKAFQLGAHDYLMKPFRVRELQIRIQRWFHSYIFSEFFSYEKTLRYHELEYLPSSNEFFLEGEKIQLSKSSKHLLSLLLVNREQLLSQTFLAEKIWGYTESLHRKNLRIKVLRLKNTLKECGIDHRIKTVHGEGYILEKS